MKHLETSMEITFANPTFNPKSGWPSVGMSTPCSMCCRLPLSHTLLNSPNSSSFLGWPGRPMIAASPTRTSPVRPTRKPSKYSPNSSFLDCTMRESHRPSSIFPLELSKTIPVRTCTSFLGLKLTDIFSIDCDSISTKASLTTCGSEVEMERLQVRSEGGGYSFTTVWSRSIIKINLRLRDEIRLLFSQHICFLELCSPSGPSNWQQRLFQFKGDRRENCGGRITWCSSFGSMNLEYQKLLGEPTLIMAFDASRKAWKQSIDRYVRISSISSCGTRENRSVALLLA